MFCLKILSHSLQLKCSVIHTLNSCTSSFSLIDVLSGEHIDFKIGLICSRACPSTLSTYKINNISMVYNFILTGRIAQSVMCVATDVSLTADQGVASLIPARSHTFLEIDHEIISTFR